MHFSDGVESRVRAPLKVVLLVAVILAVTLSAVLWKTKSVLLEDKTNFVNDSAMKQMAPLKRLVTEKLDNERNDLVRFATTREASGAGHATSFGVFDAIALVEMAQASAQWAPTWIEKGPSLRAERWTEGYDLTLLRSLPFQKVKDGASFWVRLSDAKGSPLYAQLVSVEIQAAAPQPQVQAAPALPEGAVQAVPQPVAASTRRAIIVGFSSENPLAAVTEDFIGSTNQVYIVDDRGYVASHTKASYLGNSFAEDKLTQEIAKTSKVSDTRETTDMDGQKVIGHFERVDRSNLAVVITTPAAATTALAQAFQSSLILTGGIVGLLALFVSYLVGSTIRPVTIIRQSAPPNDDAQNEIEPEAAIAPPQPMARNEIAAVVAQESQSQHDERLQTERKNAFEAFNSGLAARLREPLLAILGHAQLTKQKSSDAELTAHADSIEREARLAKETIERFQNIQETSSLGRVSDSCDLEKVTLAAIAEKALEIEGSGMTLEQHLTHVPRITGRAADVEAMIVHVLENAIEAMRDRPMKKLTVQLSWLNDRVRLMIADTGIGMSRDVQSKAFEPFYKGFEAPRHMGLGLAFVQTTLKRIGATQTLESAPGEGTVFTMEFPVEANARKDFERATAAPGLEEINRAIQDFKLGGKTPVQGTISAPTPPPSPLMETPPLTRRHEDGSTDDNSDPGFQVKIRRPKPRGP